MEGETALEELKKRLQEHNVLNNENISVEDAMMSRFLRAFIDVEYTLKRLVKYSQWREEFGVDSIDASDVSVQDQLTKKTVFILSSKDKLNRPIVYIRVKNHTVQGRDMDNLTKFMVYIIERACERCTGAQDQLCIVFDMTGFGLYNMDYQFIRQLIYLFSAYYPERLGSSLVFNAPYIFQGCWAAIKPWISEVTASKVIMINYRDQLSPHVNPDVLPLEE